VSEPEEEEPQIYLLAPRSQVRLGVHGSDSTDAVARLLEHVLGFL
jgi:hypothetical protein